MIKFFRRIRQRLISENKFSKYLIYALGEIVLVVIGIFIALQLNTWKENKQKTKAEHDFLNGIITDLERDISDLSRLLERDTTTFNAYTEILKPFKDPALNIYSPVFIKSIGNAQYTHEFEGNSIVFEDMKSSGTINNINSDVLRFSLLDYYNDSERCISTQKKNVSLINKLKDEAFTTHLDLNSLIESFIFKDNWSVQLDGLDLSFFQKDKNEDTVKQFANRVSLMKGLLKVNHLNNDELIQHARKLKTLVINYLDGQPIDHGETISKEIVDIIKSGDRNALDKLTAEKGLNACYKIEQNYGITLLSYSIKNSHFNSFKYFVDNGADLELACYDKTPLMYAVKYDHLDMVKYLLEKGADINMVSVEGKTALDYALKYNHPEIESFLNTYSITNDD